jgi:hypothetical protein
MIGTFKARAKEWGLGHSKNGKEQVAVLFEITQGEHAGQVITWFGFFTEQTTERTLDSLRHCGWDGNDFVSLAGLDANEVELVINEETYEGKTHSRVQWVNRPARLALREQMNAGALASFAAKMKGRAQQHKQQYGAQPAPSAQPRTQSQSRPRDEMDPDPSGGGDWGTPGDSDAPY